MILHNILMTKWPVNIGNAFFISFFFLHYISRKYNERELCIDMFYKPFTPVDKTRT